MNMSGIKCGENVDVHVQIDNDSGYVSQYQESSSDLAPENMNDRVQVMMPNSDVDSVYLSEDALLETPAIFTEVQVVNSSIDDEVTAGSCSTSVNLFSGLQGSAGSGTSDCSTVLQTVSPIVVKRVESGQDSFCDTNDDSNIENNANILNTCVERNKEVVDVLCSNRGLSHVPEWSYKLDLKSSRGASFVLDSETVCKQVSELNSVRRSQSRTPKKAYKTPVNPSLSPDLFSDEESRAEPPTSQSKVPPERYVLKQDRKLIRRVQNSLSGVLPPPSLTTLHLTVEQMLAKIETNKLLFWHSTGKSLRNSGLADECDGAVADTSGRTEASDCNGDDCANDSSDLGGSLLVTSSFRNCVRKTWPEVLQERFHGLHYNRSRLSEELEHLCTKYSARYVGSETQSSCTVFETNLSSPAKRKAIRLRWGIKSPGRRLSHLARRRITFSSTNIQASGSSSAGSRQVMVDARRFDLLSRRRSPRTKSPKKTPRKSPRKMIRTPSSSAKKRLSLHLQMISQDRESASSSSAARASTTKRALFQSPERNRPGSSLSKPLFPSTSGNSGTSSFKKRLTPRCALFTSPLKTSPSKRDNKRKRTDYEDVHPSKLPRSISLPTDSQQNSKGLPTSRSRSDSLFSTASSHCGELSAHHKKKLQWAVYEALRTLNIGINHPHFKQFASVLARVTRKFLPNLSANAPRPEGGTSERMLRIARLYVYAVAKGKTVDEIVQEVKRNKLKHRKPSGYVSLEEAVKNDISVARSKENVFRDKLNTMSQDGKHASVLNRQELIRTTLTKPENRIDRVRKIINFDDNPPMGNSGVR